MVCRVACGHRIVVQWTGHRNDSRSVIERWNAYVVSSVPLLAIRSCDRAAAHGVLLLPPTIHSMIWTMPTIVNATALMAPTNRRYWSSEAHAILATISPMTTIFPLIQVLHWSHHASDSQPH